MNTEYSTIWISSSRSEYCMIIIVKRKPTCISTMQHYTGRQRGKANTITGHGNQESTQLHHATRNSSYSSFLNTFYGRNGASEQVPNTE